MKKKVVNYVNNKTLYEVLKVYHKEYHEAKENGTELPRIPEYAGLAIQLIANKLASKSNFSGYSFKEEMISDGIENCILYLYNFNPEKTNNPFAYITQVIKFAFIRRIQKEERQQYIKLKLRQSYQIDHFDTCAQVEDMNDIANEFIKNYENKLTTKKKPVKVTGNTVTKFLE